MVYTRICIKIKKLQNLQKNKFWKDIGILLSIYGCCKTILQRQNNHFTYKILYVPLMFSSYTLAANLNVQIDYTRPLNQKYLKCIILSEKLQFAKQQLTRDHSRN